MHAALFLAVLAAPPTASAGQLVVPTVQVSGVDAHAAAVVTELVLEALLTRHGLPALGPADLKDLLSVEQQRQMVGCDEGRCMAEIAGALGGGRIVSGLVGTLGNTFVLTLKLIDGDSAQVIARASRSTTRLDEIGAIVGPVVDELLGAKPRPQTAVPQLVERRKAEERARAATVVPVFCGALLERYLGVLLDEAGPTRMLDARRVVLEDLWLTPYFAELDKKLECTRAREVELLRRLERQRRSARSREDAARATLAAREWTELSDGLGVLLEAYRSGAERERLGTGARAPTLPLVLRVARPPAERASSEDEESFVAASRPVVRALEALAKSDKAGFVATFDKRDGRVDPRDTYVELLGEAERGRLDVCPVWVLDASELRARMAPGPVVRVCVRRISGGEVVLRDLEVARIGAGFKLLAPEPPKSRR